MSLKLKNKTNNAALAVSAVLLLLGVGLSFLSRGYDYGAAKEVLSYKSEIGVIVPVVTDAATGKSVENAAIVFPMNGKCVYSDSEGKTDEIILPLYSDKNYIERFAKPFGITDIIVYADGYITHSVFGVQYLAGEERTVELKLIPKSLGEGKENIVMYEAPASEWADAYIDEFRPEKRASILS